MVVHESISIFTMEIFLCVYCVCYVKHFDSLTQTELTDIYYIVFI